MFTHVPLGYAKLLEADPAGMHDLSSVRVCISGSAALAPAIWRKFKHRFGVEVVETYGSSETGRIAGNSLDNKVLGSPGPALPEVKVKLSEDEELLVKSPGLFPGYYKNPAATKAALMDDGYWRTGDIAEIKDGNIFLKGRLQERIRRFGYTISPRDVEWALLKNPRIREVLVMGRQEAETPNDELVYFMATSLNDEQVKAYCKENLLFAWRPDRIIRVEALPRTRTGKASLPELRKLAELSG
jgi:long-chain acyl-CoA synthetase